MITIDRLSDGLLLTPSSTAAPVFITDAALPVALGPAIVALALGVHAMERARVEGYAHGHGDGLAEGRAAERLEHERRVRRAV